MGLNPQKTADLVRFTKEILNGKLHFLCSETKKDASNDRSNFISVSNKAIEDLSPSYVSASTNSVVTR